MGSYDFNNFISNNGGNMKYQCDYCEKIFDEKDLDNDTEDGLICKACQEKGDYEANVAADRDVEAFREQR